MHQDPQLLEISVSSSGTKALLSQHGVRHANELDHNCDLFQCCFRSLFPEICDKFEENLPNCFSAGNPEKFHVHYTHSMEFLDEFEAKLPFIETLEEFRASDEYNSFLGTD